MPSILLLGVICGGCALVGYDPWNEADALAEGPEGAPFQRTDEPDGGGPAASDARPPGNGPRLDGGDQPVGPGDASEGDAGAVPVPEDAGTGSNGGPDGGPDDNTDGGGQGQVDAGTACSVTARNPCGGCGALRGSPGDPCGNCGLGTLTCEGPQALICTGAPTSIPTVPAGGALLDDFEDDDHFVDQSIGFDGSWYTTSDGTAGRIVPAPGDSPVPSEPGAFGSENKMRLSVTRAFTRWGATLSTYLFRDACADASATTGFRFAARGEGTFEVRFATGETALPMWGGHCGVNDPTVDCNDHFEYEVTATDAWAIHEVPWSATYQGGFGTRFPALAPDQLIYIEFLIPADSEAEIELDDIGFY